MRSIQLALLAMLVLGSGEAAAGQVELLATGELTLGFGALPVLTLPISPTSIAVSSTGGFTLPAGLVAETQVALPRSLFTGMSVFSGLSVTGVSNGPLSFNGESGLGTGPLAGTMLVNVLQLFALTLPLSVVGSPGATGGYNSAVILHVFGQGWTSGTASVTGLPTDTPFFLSTTVVFHGNDARSPGHAGDLVLVSPFKVVTNVIGTTAGFAILELQFTPEPGSLALLGTALALVFWLARRRRGRDPQAASSTNCNS